MAQLADFDTEKKYKATIKKTDRLTPKNTEEIREIVLEVNDPEFECEIDESFGVLLDSKNEFGNSKHHRLYTCADIPKRTGDTTELTMLVKRCSYVDDFSGEKYQGTASNYLCDRQAGDQLTLTGPFKLPFTVPADKTANLLLIGMGTGIAPFRAFVKHIYKNVKNWEGKVRLFYGARSGLELLYLNDKDGDLTNYYDESTFAAFSSLSPRPHMSDPIALDEALEKQTTELKEILQQSNTYVYVAGFESVKKNLDASFSKILGSEENWLIRKAELVAGRKWAEIIY